MSKNNIAVLYGGGQNPLGNYTLAEVTSYILEYSNGEVYGIHKSFLGITDEACYEKLTNKQVDIMYSTIGTYLETCREVNTEGVIYLDKVKKVFERLEIGILIVCGGDGSCRAVEPIIQYTGIKVAFIPSTIDGMNGTDTIGKETAITESYNATVFMATDCFAIYNPKFIGSRVAVVEVQGRNKDDILLGVLDSILGKKKIGHYELEDIVLIAIPTGHTWSLQSLIDKIKDIENPTLIIVSEGAIPIEKKYSLIQGEGIGAKIANMININGKREARCHVVGYLSQITDRITLGNKMFIKNWVDKSLSYIIFYASSSKATICKDGEFMHINISELVEQNPNSNSIVPLKEEDIERFNKYLI